ncbi:MAG TPA: response regulator transcription factor [Bryobacteraceae bacterium]|nr:response regulator transcription factor [Bryobacteraceae bacterium]
METSSATRVFAVEDSPVILSAIHEMLAGIPGVSIAGSAAEARVAIREIQRLLPDVIILDLHLKSGTGVDVLRAVKRHQGAAPVSIIFSSSLDRFCRQFCRRQGADFFVDKSGDYSRLTEVIRSIATGIFGNGLPGQLCPGDN